MVSNSGEVEVFLGHIRRAGATSIQEPKNLIFSAIVIKQSPCSPLSAASKITKDAVDRMTLYFRSQFSADEESNDAATLYFWFRKERMDERGAWLQIDLEINF